MSRLRETTRDLRKLLLRPGRGGGLLEEYNGSITNWRRKALLCQEVPNGLVALLVGECPTEQCRIHRRSHSREQYRLKRIALVGANVGMGEGANMHDEPAGILSGPSRRIQRPLLVALLTHDRPEGRIRISSSKRLRQRRCWRRLRRGRAYEWTELVVIASWAHWFVTWRLSAFRGARYILLSTQQALAMMVVETLGFLRTRAKMALGP